MSQDRQLISLSRQCSHDFFASSSVSDASTLLCSFMICFERSLFSVNVTPHLEIIPSALVCFQIAGQFADGRGQSGGHDLRWFAGTELRRHSRSLLCLLTQALSPRPELVPAIRDNYRSATMIAKYARSVRGLWPVTTCFQRQMS